jgi:hypothetical protein
VNDLLKKKIEQMVSQAIEDTFSDSLIYGVGFLKVTTDGTDLDIQHIPFAELDVELEKVVELKKFMVSN